MKKFLCRFLVICFFLAGCARPLPIDVSETAPTFPPEAVVVYVRTGCPYCGQALELLAQSDVAPIIRNVSKERRAYEELLAIYREHFPEQPIIVPVIGKNGTYLRGFNRFSIWELLYDVAVTDPDDFEYCE